MDINLNIYAKFVMRAILITLMITLTEGLCYLLMVVPMEPGWSVG